MNKSTKDKYVHNFTLFSYYFLIWLKFIFHINMNMYRNSGRIRTTILKMNKKSCFIELKSSTYLNEREREINLRFYRNP